VPGVLAGTPFILNEVMVSSETNLTGAIIKGIDPASVGGVTELETNVVEGTLDALKAGVPVPLGARKRRLMQVYHELIWVDGGSPQKAAGGKADGGGGRRDGDGDGDGDEEEDEEWPEERGEEMPAATAAPDAKKGRLPGAVDEDVTSPEVSALPGIAMGREMARNLRVDVGSRVTVTSPMGGELGPMGPVPRSKVFKVAAIFYSGMYEYDTKFVYIELPEAQRFFKTNGTVTGLELKLTDIYESRPITQAIMSAIGGYPYHTRDWMQMNRNLFSALKLEKLAMFIILTFIVLVASFNIVSTLIMIVLTRGKEIAILKSMGASRRGVLRIFVYEGLIIGIIGTLLGLVAGVALCVFVEKFGLRLDPEVYYIEKLPVRMKLHEFAVVGVAALGISLAATIYPAWVASRLKPVEGLRYE
jgi:lipoprotein-releasing system permease protein